MNEEPSTNNQQRGPIRRVVACWHGLNEWLKAFLIAIALLAVAHLFILRWVTVKSTSMYGTLHPGDLLGVTLWPSWTGFDRGDIAVFRDPMQDDRAMARRQLLVKRIVGLPGDVVELRDGELFVNGLLVPVAPQQTRSWLVRMKKGSDAKAFVAGLGLPSGTWHSDDVELDLPLTHVQAFELRRRADVLSIDRMRSMRGSPGHIFPFSPYYKWNADDYGPIIIPRTGDHLRIDQRTLPLYDRLITRYEGNDLEVAKRTLTINGEETREYVVRQDHYFVLGDSRHYSADSRYWGFVPADHLVGRAAFVLLGNDASGGGIRSDRWFLGLH